MNTPDKETYTDAEIAGMLAAGQIHKTRPMSNQGESPNYVIDPAYPHLGGNIAGGDAWTYDPPLWEFLLKYFGVKSVLDVGCGEGHALEWFKNKGIYTTGIEGLWANVKSTRAKGLPCHFHDYLKGPSEFAAQEIQNFDLVWCCEVLEHIPEGPPLDNLIKDLTRGSVIAVTHAFPGQRGHNHVNCQLPDYWVNAIQELGYTLSPVSRAIRALSESPHFQRSGLVFER